MFGPFYLRWYVPGTRAVQTCQTSPVRVSQVMMQCPFNTRNAVMDSAQSRPQFCRPGPSSLEASVPVVNFAVYPFVCGQGGRWEEG